jgi:hypothetical protein
VLLLRARVRRLVGATAVFAVLVGGGALEALPTYASAAEVEASAPAAERPSKPVKAMTAKQRKAQVKRDEQLRALGPVLRDEKRLQKWAKSAKLTQPSGSEPFAASQAQGLDLPTIQGAYWGVKPRVSWRVG